MFVNPKLFIIIIILFIKGDFDGTLVIYLELCKCNS